MSDQGKLRKVLEGILSSQSFDLLSGFSSDSSWEALVPEEKDLLAQLFLLSAEAGAPQGTDRAKMLAAYKAACRLSPSRARAWYRLGTCLALGEKQEEIAEAVEVLKKAVGLDGRFFDAQHALASASLRLGAIRADEALLVASLDAFARAAELVGHMEDRSTAPGEFYWHWGIAWFVLARHCGEPAELVQTLKMYELARQKGLAKPDFLNDFANAFVELALLTSNDALTKRAIELYAEAVEATPEGGYDKAVRIFNLGCCFQHLYDDSRDVGQFDAASKAFAEVAEMTKELPAVWHRWGLLFFRRAQFEHSRQFAEKALAILQVTETKGLEHPIALCASARILLWLGREDEDFELLRRAERYAARAVALQEAQGEDFAEPFSVLALSFYELGLYFADDRFFAKAIALVHERLLAHSKSAALWHVLALAKCADGENQGSEKVLKEALVCFSLASRSAYAAQPAFWNDWGIALLTLANWTEDVPMVLDAITKFETAIGLCPENSEKWAFNLAKAYDILGDLAGEEGCYDRAIQLLSELLGKDPENAEHRYQLGCALFHKGVSGADWGCLVAAASYLEEYLALEPEDDDAWLDYGHALLHLGVQEGGAAPSQWFAAEEALLRARWLGSDRASYYLACLYSLLGNFEEAVGCLYRAVDEETMPPLSEVVEDEWLAPIASTVVFRDFLQYARQQEL